MPGVPQDPLLTLNCTTLVVQDSAGAPAQVIQNSTSSFSVWTDFQLSGTFAPFIVSLAIPYTVTYYYESETGGASGTLGAVNGNLIAGEFDYDFDDTTLNVPPGTLAPDLYELSCVVTFGGAPPMTGFFDEVDIQIF